MSDLTTTNALTISRFRCDPGAGLIKLNLPARVGPLYLGSMSIQKIAGIGTGVVTGVITEGHEGGAPGRANLQVSEDVFNTVVTLCSPAGEHSLCLTFDTTTYAPVGLEVMP